jgi:hypothetical protein
VNERKTLLEMSALGTVSQNQPKETTTLSLSGYFSDQPTTEQQAMTLGLVCCQSELANSDTLGKFQ